MQEVQSCLKKKKTLNVVLAALKLDAYHLSFQPWVSEMLVVS